MEKRKARLTKRRQRQLLQLDNPTNPLWHVENENNEVYTWDDALLLLNVRHIAFCFIVLQSTLTN